MSTLSEVLEGIRKMPAGGVAGEPLRLAVMEACGWGGTEDKSPPREGPLLEVIRTRVQVGIALRLGDVMNSRGGAAYVYVMSPHQGDVNV